jgi:hypothetical protein
MASHKKLRIAAAALVTVAVIVVVALWATVRAARQVRPFYQQAMAIKPEVLSRGRQELESRATALYSDVKKGGAWQAVFTDEQVNGWLATQLTAAGNNADAAAEPIDGVLTHIREPRIAISAGLVTLGFKTTQGGVETIVSVDASVFLTEQGDVAARLVKVQAGTLPLPVAIVADELAAACERMSLPVLWTENDGHPVAMVRVGDANSEKMRWFIDSLELMDGEVFIAGHTDLTPDFGQRTRSQRRGVEKFGAEPNLSTELQLEDYELRLSPNDSESMLEVARRDASRRGSDDPPGKN